MVKLGYGKQGKQRKQAAQAKYKTRQVYQMVRKVTKKSSTAANKKAAKAKGGTVVNQPAPPSKHQQAKAKGKPVGGATGKAGKVASKVAAIPATTSTSTAITASAKVVCSLNPNFSLGANYNNIVTAVYNAFVKLVPAAIVQLTRNAINFSTPANTGRHLRVGGFYPYGNHLQLQCRWLQTPALAYVNKHKLTIVNASHLLAKSNNLQLFNVCACGKCKACKANIAHCANILHMQANAYASGAIATTNAVTTK